VSEDEGMLVAIGGRVMCMRLKVPRMSLVVVVCWASSCCFVFCCLLANFCLSADLTCFLLMASLLRLTCFGLAAVSREIIGRMC